MVIDRECVSNNSAKLHAALGATEGQGRDARMETAAQAVNGYVAFYGTTWTEVGRHDIDWSGGHHAHCEWRSQLNRFFQLSSLAAVYAETGDEQYAEAAHDYIEDWMRAHPACEGWEAAEYDNTLNLPIRVKNWATYLPVFFTSPIFTDRFVSQVIESITVQLNWLLKNLKGRGNWYIAQADALLTTAIRFDFLPDAAIWRSRGVKILNEAFFRQVLPDGAHIERNPGYHDWMRRVFQQYWRLGRAMPELGLVMDAETVKRMWHYTLAYTRPNGQGCALHDSKGGHTGQRHSDWTQQYIAFLQDAGLPQELPPVHQFFPQGGQAFLRENWEEDATYLTFDASLLESAHWHAGRNAVQLHAYGRSLIVDPGTFTYEGSDPFQGYGTSTRAHSTITFNGWDQTWSTQTVDYREADGYDLVYSLYDGGYWKGAHRGGWFSPGHGEGFHGEHHRSLLWIRGRAIVVIDHVYQTAAEGNHATMESAWQFSRGALEIDAANRAFTKHDDGNVLMLFPLMPENARLTIHEGETDPLRGWVPGDTAARKHHPAPQLVLHVDPVGPWNDDLVTVLLPFPGAAMPDVTAEASNVDRHGIGTLTLRWGDGSTDEIIWSRRLLRAIAQHGELDTDACLVHLQKDVNGRLTKGLVVDGTYCEPYTTDVRSRLATFVIGE